MSASTPIPEGRQLAVTWGVEREFGGMTSALLRRSRAFADRTGRPVEIITFDLRDDYDDILASLRDRGLFTDGLVHRNLWDDLSERTDYPADMTGASPKALKSFSPLKGADAGDGRTRTRLDASGTILQVDRYRADGSLAISDRRDTTFRGRVGGRSTVLCDGTGTPVVGFTRIRPLYRAWLDLLLRDDDAFLIVDSKTSAPTIAEYDNPRATTVYLMHNSHLVGERRPWDEVKASRRESLVALPLFDATVVLSQRQREDLVLLLGTGDRVEVVPNSAPLPSAPVAFDRPPGAGMSVGSLDARKRPEHAIEAVLAARGRGADVTLDVYGEGPKRAAVDALAAASDGAVVPRGFSAGAVDAFASASFFTLTSTTEGFPLVLAEGMARGCIPISYDIPYGPADIIEDGVSGFLVPPGDVDALSRTIERVATASPEQLQAWRVAAVNASASFSDDAVTDRWAEVLERARTRRVARGRAFTLDAVSSKVRRNASGAEVTLDFRLRGLDVSPGDLDAAIAVHGTSASIELRRPAEVKRTLRRGVWRATARVEAGALSWVAEKEPLSATLEARVDGRFATTE